MLLGRPEVAVFVIATDQGVAYEESNNSLKQFLTDNLAFYEETVDGIKELRSEVKREWLNQTWLNLQRNKSITANLKCIGY